MNCTCGFTELADETLTDHLHLVFESPDATAPDGQLHQETTLRSCSCGLLAPTSAALDAHFLSVFTPPDSIAADGQKHQPVSRQPSA